MLRRICGKEGRLHTVSQRLVLIPQEPVVPDTGDLPHEMVNELGNVAGFRGNAHEFHAAGLGEQAGPVQVVFAGQSTDFCRAAAGFFFSRRRGLFFFDGN